MSDLNALAKLQWQDPHNRETREFVLTEGATATIGRSSNNDIQIAEHHVSRQHAVINYREGVFMINDLGSSNGTFVNNNKVEEPFPLFAGDEIRLYVPLMRFLAVAEGDAEKAQETGSYITATNPGGQGSLIVTNGPQEGQTIPLLLNQVTVGRATNNATWEILLQDPSVSRPHARLEKHGDSWHIMDLGSSNGTRVNKNVVDHKPYALADGDTVELGRSILLFRTGWKAPEERDFMNHGPTIPSR
jgi:pSer/pThr/pTyr-binding forkhead associated (FHA) protein